jgi:hypothetical protein
MEQSEEDMRLTRLEREREKRKERAVREETVRKKRKRGILGGFWE